MISKTLARRLERLEEQRPSTDVVKFWQIVTIDSAGHVEQVINSPHSPRWFPSRAAKQDSWTIMTLNARVAGQSAKVRYFAAGWPPRLHPTPPRWHHIQKQLAIMTQLNLSDTISFLSRTPGALSALLRDLPDAWTHRNEGEGTWTVDDVVGHLIHGEQTDWMPRARLILEHGESRAFEPFDMMGHIQVCEGKSLDGLVDEFARLRAANLADLHAQGLRDADLALRGRHPALGPVTLSELLATWAAHDLTHLHQLSRIMAHQYREAVGPWAAYLGVMRCAGHSSV